MKIFYNLAQQIVELASDIDEFQDPSDAMSDRVADKLYAAQERRERELDALCQQVLREMVIEAARQAVRQSGKEIA